MSKQNVNVARFARNVEWDFFCDFQTPWFFLVILDWFQTALHFDAVDINDDLTIDLDEALDHLGKAKTGLQGVLHRFVSTPSWFASIDTNQDGKISTWEFDSDLTDEAMAKFNQMFYQTD